MDCLPPPAPIGWQDRIVASPSISLGQHRPGDARVLITLTLRDALDVSRTHSAAWADALSAASDLIRARRMLRDARDRAAVGLASSSDVARASADHDAALLRVRAIARLAPHAAAYLDCIMRTE